jgi:ketosteroid isomerase-like protein
MRRTTVVAAALGAIRFLMLPALLWSQAVDARDGSAEEQVKVLEAQVAKAIVKGEIGFFEKHYADDFTAVRGDGGLGTRAQELDNLRSGTTKFESYDIGELTVRVYGDAAVVSALYSVKSTINGKRYDGDVRATRVWVKRNREWKLVRHHVTRVAPASR